MRRIAMLSAMLLVAASLFAVSSADIQSAAMQLNVPYDELEAFVQKYNSTSITSDGADVIPLETICEDFFSNGIVADMKYGGQTVRLTFEVDSLQKNGSYDPSLAAYDELWLYRYVINSTDIWDSDLTRCASLKVYPSESELGKLMNVSPGQTLTVEGRIETVGNEFVTFIYMYGARII